MEIAHLGARRHAQVLLPVAALPIGSPERHRGWIEEEK
jgi:hypothetical protein